MAANLTAIGVHMAVNLSSVLPDAEFVRSRSMLSNRGMVAQPNDGSKSNCMSAYATFARLPTIEHNHGAAAPGFAAVVSNFAAGKLSAAYGWTSVDEHEFTAAVTRAGGVVHASDFLYNLEVLSQLPPAQLVPLPPPPPSPPLLLQRRVHTVAFVNSDGDNLQLLQNDWMSTAHWSHPDRGKQPAGWSYSPATAVLLPSLLAYAQRTAGANDTLSTGPSGMGYAYPQLFPAGLNQQFAEATGELMARSGMTVANVIGVVPSAESVVHLASNPRIAGIVYFTFGVASQGYAGLHGNVAYVNGTPVVGLRSNLWGDATSGDKVGVPGLVRNLRRLPKDPADPQSYSVVVNELGNNFSEVVEASALLAADDGFDVVTPEQLLSRLQTNTGQRQQCPMPTGRWAEQAGNLPKCWLPGDGSSCVMTCTTLLKIPLNVACDLRVCSNLTLAPTRLHFICADTGKVCPKHASHPGSTSDTTAI